MKHFKFFFNIAVLCIVVFTAELSEPAKLIIIAVSALPATILSIAVAILFCSDNYLYKKRTEFILSLLKRFDESVLGIKEDGKDK